MRSRECEHKVSSNFDMIFSVHSENLNSSASNGAGDIVSGQLSSVRIWNLEVNDNSYLFYTKT